MPRPLSTFLRMRDLSTLYMVAAVRLRIRDSTLRWKMSTRYEIEIMPPCLSGQGWSNDCLRHQSQHWREANPLSLLLVVGGENLVVSRSEPAIYYLLRGCRCFLERQPMKLNGEIHTSSLSYL